MSTLSLTPNFTNADEFYEYLLNAHVGLSKSDSDLLNARLIILLSNHIGDLNALKQAVDLAKEPGLK